MERSTAYLYRLLTRQFAGVDKDDVRDAIGTAQLVTAERVMMVREPVLNEEAFMTCVARRALNVMVKRKKRHDYPQAGDESWRLFERQHLSANSELELDASIESRRLLEVLPVSYSEVLRLHYLEGITLDEASKRVGVSAECMRKRHERALRMARRLLGTTYAGKRAASTVDSK
ncbi:MAG: sigma factor-like helix-turn-helix DNA-binding protein [bacterium]|nr:sigma factor-like helix-turn-helix DNA-binding protein [bacterium]